MKLSCAFILLGVFLFVEVNSKAVEDPNNPPNELICKSLCDHCGLTGFYCGDECICETPEGQEENIQCLATMHSNCIELNVPWEIMIKGSSGHYYLRDRLAEVIDKKMNENKNKLQEAEKQADEITEIPKTKISIKKVNPLPKLKVKNIKKPIEEIPIIREPRQVGEGNENFEEKTLLNVEEVAAAEPAAAESVAVANAESDAIVGASVPAIAVPAAAAAGKAAATVFRPFSAINLNPLRPITNLGDTKNILGAPAIFILPTTTTTTLLPPIRRFGTVLRENFQNSKLGASIQSSKLGASIQSLAAKNQIVGDANPFANFKLGRNAAAAGSTVGAPAPDVGAPAPDVGAPAPDVGAPAPDVGAPAGVIVQPAHTL